MSHRCNILLFTESLGSGGAERQLVGLAVALKKQGYNVTVMTYIENQFYEPVLREHSVKFILCKSEKNKYVRLFHVAKIISEMRPDTVISFLSSSNQMMCLLKPIMRFRLIVSERNTTVKWGRYEKVLFRLYRFADVVVANSHYECENIKTHEQALQNKTIAITNYVDTCLFAPADHNANKVPTILCVGRVTEQKNVLRFIDAVKQIKDKGLVFKVKWFGDQTDFEYSSLVSNKLNALNLHDVLHFYKPSQNILQEYQNADIFCLPSIREGYPNVVCEAMSCELPIACGNICENPKIVKDDVNGYLFNPYDAAEISQILERLICLTPSERRDIGKRNRQQMISNNSIEAYCQRYIDIL